MNWQTFATAGAETAIEAVVGPGQLDSATEAARSALCAARVMRANGKAG